MTRSVKRIQIKNTNRSNLKLLGQLIPHTKITKPNVKNKHLIIDVNIGAHNYMLHATKGWRRRKIVGAL